MYRLSDIFIGDYQVVEYFASNPAVYNARYDIQGYPGIRISMPSLTPILAGADGFVVETGFEEAGKGKFITLRHEGFLTTYGHLNDILVQKDERVVSGQLIAHSNQSGLTEIPCLYFGVAPCDNAGTKTEDNGFGGYIDPLGELVDWDVKDIKEPVTKAELLDEMKLSSKEYSILSAQATNYKVIISFLKQTSFEDFLKEAGRVPVNLDLTPDDSTGGESVTLFLRALDEEYNNLNKRVEDLEKEIEEIKKERVAEEPKKEKDEEKVENASSEKPGIVIRLLHAVKNFIFVA